MSHLDILLVGVSQMERTILEGFIGEGVSFSYADSPNQISQIAKQKNPKITICDAETPGVDVRKICDSLETSKPCVFLSSRDKDTERRKSLLKFKNCYLTRPYSEEQLSQAVLFATGQSGNYPGDDMILATH